MSPRKKAKAAFVSALVLLLLGGLAAYASILQLKKSERWVTHTREVQATLGDVEFATAKLGRARLAYMTKGDSAYLREFSDALEEIPRQLQHLRSLTSDNDSQQKLCARLERVTQQRIDISRRAVEQKQAHPDYEERQEEIIRQSTPFLLETTNIVQQMRKEEQQLLRVRERDVYSSSVVTYSILALTLVLAVAMFFVHFRLLSGELTAREHAEQAARGLSGRLMQAQDDERRRFSRELHDSVGQYLASLKMNLETLATSPDQSKRYEECLKLIDACVLETRTISHLLHPPILDVAGLSSAATWFVQGFAERSGIQVKADIPETDDRLPTEVELVLFRVLQESLTNIHRHSRSSKADVALRMAPGKAMLSVRDHGVGIPDEVLARFRDGGTTGVGLAGMRERVRELGGRFDVESDVRGTRVSVSVPISKEQQVSRDRAAS